MGINIMNIKKNYLIGLSLVLCIFGLLFCLFKITPFFQSDLQPIAIIEQDNKEIYRINLANVKEEYYIDINSSFSSKILVEPYKISFCESTCPDKICEHYGKISKPGQCAVCLPAKIVIKINGIDQKIDSITG